jgi:uncharacterized FAD-dependent dehydrogenase
MQHEVLLQLSPKDAAQSAVISENIANELGLDPKRVTGFHFIKKSIDARKRNVLINLKLRAFVDEPFFDATIPDFAFPDVRKSAKRTLIIGAGPAGLFAALELIQQGIKPIILERGKDVRERRRDLAALNKEGILNEDSNYCFGEGGAGTYSDGKLYTRSTKRGNVDKVLQLLVHFGADPAILYTAHPHIGTNKLPGIIQNIRQQIIEAGGEVHFNERVTDFTIENQRVKSVRCASGNSFEGNNLILATGHSAKDIYLLLHNKNILIEAKPFALGVRIEHPQSLIDSIQYHCPSTIVRNEFLPPAAYQLVEQVNGRGVFSFCMCPGGIIATASTVQNELVVNGWSPSKRNNPFANSGMVVQIGLEDVVKGMKNKGEGMNLPAEGWGNPLLLHHFQENVERRAYTAGGGKFVAPAQRMTDFVQGRTSSTLPENSYLRGVVPVNMKDVLPDFVFSSLQNAFKAFGKKMKGYYTEEATIIAPESRTSSPVRIPRDPETLQHPQISNLYPCAEGAGYAGGIVSAAMDGQRVANHLSIFSAADNFLL